MEYIKNIVQSRIIILVLENAKADFLKDRTVGDLNKKREKSLYNVVGSIVNILKELL